MESTFTVKIKEEILKYTLPSELKTTDEFIKWYEPIKQKVQVAVLGVHEKVREALITQEKEKIISEEGGKRNIWAITGEDGTSLMKSVPSIRSKIARTLWEKSEEDLKKIKPTSEDDLKELILGFPDLGRFRISCDFSMDVECALKGLLHTDEHGRQTLLNEYELKGEVKDYVYDLSRKHPGRGHRARQFAVSVPVGSTNADTCYVEIQLMTWLQATWDLRNHPMYEWTRDGGDLPDQLIINDVALAETLHLVDEQASRNWKEFVTIRKEGNR